MSAEWLVVDIGCLGCDAESDMAGRFDSKERAEEVAEEFDEKFSWRGGGQHSFKVFKLPPPNAINHKYKEDN